jgi:hypothetical protein
MMKFLKNKRAAEEVVTQLYWLGQLLLIVTVVFLPLFLYVNSVGNEVGFMKNYVARDLALVVDVAQSIDGDLILEYETPVDIKVFELTPEGIKVGVDKDSSQAFYFILHSTRSRDKLESYIEPGKIVLEEGQILVVRKEGKKIYIEAT